MSANSTLALQPSPWPRSRSQHAASRLRPWRSRRIARAVGIRELRCRGRGRAGVNATNVHDRGVAAASGRARVVNPRPRRVALVCRIRSQSSVLRFEKFPTSPGLDKLIRWQVRKAVPFKIEEAQLTWVPGIELPGGGREYIVTLARRDIIESYERACEAAGAYAGIVDMASVNLINAVIAEHPAGAPPADWLLVHVAPDYSTLAVVRGGDVIFFRSRPVEHDDDLTDLVHQTAMYHEDRLGPGGFSRVVLAGASSRGLAQGERLWRDLEERRPPIEPPTSGAPSRCGRMTRDRSCSTVSRHRSVQCIML